MTLFNRYFDRQSMEEHVYFNDSSRDFLANHSLKTNELINDAVKESAKSSEIKTMLELNSNQIFIGMISTQYKAKIVNILIYPFILLFQRKSNFFHKIFLGRSKISRKTYQIMYSIYSLQRGK